MVCCSKGDSKDVLGHGMVRHLFNPVTLPKDLWNNWGYFFMKIHFLKACYLCFLVSVLSYETETYAAVSQLLNNNFYQNPAELSLVQQIQLIGGNVFISPSFQFNGTSYNQTGSATSRVTNSLPYLLTAKRLTSKWVLGINITPSGYGHLNWPMDSIVANSSTVTNLLYYRAGVQSSYQFTDNLALGIGAHFEYNSLLELNFMLPGFGQEINKVKDLNSSADIGLYYKINARNFLTAAIYTPVHDVGYGTSTLGPIVSNNLSLNIAEASVAYIGLQHLLNERWFLEEKIYWSGWVIQKNINYINTAMGSFTAATNWKNVWSYQMSNRYKVTEKIALTGSMIYETNPTTVVTNAIGYPLAACASISAGLDITLQKALSTQLIYGYGGFVSKSAINNANSAGSVAFRFQVLMLQFTFKT